MLGETREREELRDRCRERAWLRSVCQPASLIQFRNDVSWRLLDRLFDGPEPPENRESQWRALERLAYWYWRAFVALQTQRRRLNPV